MKIEIEIDVKDPIQNAAFANFVVALGAASKAVTSLREALGPIVKENIPISQDNRTEAPKTKTRSKKAEAVEVVEPETVEAEASDPVNFSLVEDEPKQAEKMAAADAPTLMQIRQLVQAKAPDHKDAIKTKLVELGAQNVSTLDAKHFSAMHEFLTAL